VAPVAPVAPVAEYDSKTEGQEKFVFEVVVFAVNEHIQNILFSVKNTYALLFNNN
jgi:hypothetical protein